MRRKGVRLVALMIALAAMFAVLPHVAGAAAPKAEDFLIIIEADYSRLTLYQYGKKVAVWPVAVGKPETPSPLGVFRIVTKERGWGTGFGTRWMGLSCTWGKFGIHGTNKPSSIGTSASHGCFRMHNRDVEKLYGMVPSGTRVIVESGPYGPLAYALRTLAPGDRGSDVRQVQMRLAIHGYSPGAIDGIYGEGMKAALIRFKTDKGLAREHSVDARTYRALGMTLFE